MLVRRICEEPTSTNNAQATYYDQARVNRRSKRGTHIDRLWPTITLFATVAFIFMLPKDFKFGPGVLAGLFGRFLVISYLGWLLTVGLHALKLHKQAVPATGD